MGVRTEADYTLALKALLPPGPAWSAEQAAAVHALLAGLAPELARLDARAGDLLIEMDPAAVTELVPDWERVMGLPDACLGAAPAFVDRQQAVRDRLVAMGGQSRAYFLGLIQRLGFAVRIEEDRPYRVGLGACAERLCSRAMSFVWHVIENDSEAIAPGDMDAVLAARAAMECIVNRYKPAHTEVRFHYFDFLVPEDLVGLFITEAGDVLVSNHYRN